MNNIIRKVTEWIQLVEKPEVTFIEYLRRIYSSQPEFIENQRRWYLDILKKYGSIYGEESEVIIARAPARVNLIGMHIDHRGGNVNPLAAKDMIVVASARDDDEVVLNDIDDEEFNPRRFRISEELPPFKIRDWDEWTKGRSEEIKRRGLAGDWANYVKAAALYLQELNRNDDGSYKNKLRGMNALVAGNIPIASGLGSSSALVVASAEALVYINELDISPERFVEICGTAEWYVGTRGGAGDHAAIKLSKRGHISNIGFFPLRVDFAPFLDGYRVAICNTLKRAKKSAGAKSIFNERVATYEIGLMLLKKAFPQLRGKVEHLRDLNTVNLKVDEAWFYKMLKPLPLRITREQLLHQSPEAIDRLRELFRTHDEPADGYRVRGVVLFGIAECERSRVAAQRLKEGDMRAYGELISISHEGDRVVRFVNGEKVEVSNEITDEYLDKLISDLRSKERARVESARLYRQPGDYAVSCEELDELVDIAMSVDGVLGAGRTGAGLGGCISVLIEKDRTDEFIRVVSDGYYRPRNLPVAVEVCFPVEGAGVIKL